MLIKILLASWLAGVNGLSYEDWMLFGASMELRLEQIQVNSGSAMKIGIIHPGTGNHKVWVSPKIKEDRKAYRAVTGALNAVSHATKWSVAFTEIPDENSAGIRMRISDGRDRGFWHQVMNPKSRKVYEVRTGQQAHCVRLISSHRVVGADIVFYSVREAQIENIVMHELGHWLGLPHSLEDRDVMYKHYNPSIKLFSRKEEAVINLILSQKPGAQPRRPADIAYMESVIRTNAEFLNRDAIRSAPR